MRIKLIACEVMEKELRAVIAQKNLQMDVEFIELGLHNVPKQLHSRLQETLWETRGYDRVLLAFGLCGGAAAGLRNTDAVLTIPRCHDCVPMLLGSTERYRACQQQEPGTYYLCRGWVEAGQTLVQEYTDWCERFGEAKAKKLQRAMYANYRRLLYIDTPVPCGEEVPRRAAQSAALLDLAYGETPGGLAIMEQLLTGPWDDPEQFINIPPRGVVSEEDFGI